MPEGPIGPEGIISENLTTSEFVLSNLKTFTITGTTSRNCFMWPNLLSYCSVNIAQNCLQFLWHVECTWGHFLCEF